MVYSLPLYIETFVVVQSCAELCPFCADGATPMGVILPSGNFPILEAVCLDQIQSIRGVPSNCYDQTKSGFAYHCGCPNAEVPSDASGCTLCADGKFDNPLLVANVDIASFFPDNALTCESIDVLLRSVD